MGKGTLAKIKNRLKQAFQKLNAFSYRFPTLRQGCIRLVKKLRLHAFLSRLTQNQPPPGAGSTPGLQEQDPSARAKRILAQIQKAQQGQREES
jgi:hypothetical protein